MAGARRIWFHRAYRQFTGGHLKHAHYVAHARRMPGFAVRLAFTGAPPSASCARDRQRLWSAAPAEIVEAWSPVKGDLLFVAGTDWRHLDASRLRDAPHPTINLVQGLRHADPGRDLYRYLPRPAIRICVSAEVADAIAATGRACGPILTIPNATDLRAQEHGQAVRHRPVTVFGYKRPDLAAALCARLRGRGIPHECVTRFLGRERFLRLLRDTRVAVCLPQPTEGFYLPALEAMACGCLVVTLDAGGNRGFCRHDENCLVAPDHPDGLAAAVLAALGLSVDARTGFLAAATATVAAHAPSVERARFHAVLRDADRLWSEARRASGVPPMRLAHRGPRGAIPDAPYRPRLAFMIVGAQKCGTTALARFLGSHPQIGITTPKEAHLFDAPEYSRDWTPADIDERYRPSFEPRRFAGPGFVLGDATPIYLYLDDVAAELGRYNPALQVVVLLRDPVQRAISHYYMEKGRDAERLPLWLALVLEPLRLHRDRDPRAPETAARRHSYRARGLYSRQLENLYRVFPRERVLLLRSEDLLEHHAAVLRRVFGFLGVSREVGVPRQVVFKGARGDRRHRVVSWLLRLSYAVESRRMRKLLQAAAGPRHRTAVPLTARRP